MNATVDALESSVRLYTPFVLAFYDLFVLQFSSRAAWRYSSSRILELYNRHVSSHHLEVGVGTGYFLDKATFPVAHPHITLIDLNPNTLNTTTRRIARYAPHCIVANALEPQPLEAQFDSIGMNYVLHTMPGNMRDKAVTFGHLRSYLRDGGVVFGTTLLGQGVVLNPLARGLMGMYNRLKWLSNQQDNKADLVHAIGANFNRYDLQVFGPTAVFEAWV